MVAVFVGLRQSVRVSIVTMPLRLACQRRFFEWFRLRNCLARCLMGRPTSLQDVRYKTVLKKFAMEAIASRFFRPRVVFLFYFCLFFYVFLPFLFRSKKRELRPRHHELRGLRLPRSRLTADQHRPEGRKVSNCDPKPFPSPCGKAFELAK